MSPSLMHEHVATLLARMVAAWTEEKNIDVKGCGTMTFQRQDLERGLEPDQCFYIQNEALVRSHETLDLRRDPPPDLVIEVDLASPSRRRLPLYESLGVPEVWVWRSETLTIPALNAEGAYATRNESTVLPEFSFAVAAGLLAQRQELSDTQLIRRFRAAIRGGKRKSSKNRK